MNKLKQQIFIVIFSFFVWGMESTYSTESGVNIVVDSPEQLTGYTLTLQLTGDEGKPLYTQTIDVSKIPPYNSHYIPLASNFIKQLPDHVLGKNEACISLYDPQGRIDTECLIVDWKLRNPFPVLNIKINAKKLASVESPLDRFGMALLTAPAA